MARNKLYLNYYQYSMSTVQIIRIYWIANRMFAFVVLYRFNHALVVVKVVIFSSDVRLKAF